ncbi:hypothetical protein HY947_02930 [Candidatus Gottesmanbacteria bacterium]|nr:hypothetical protein [Candidatus Gottesmanbacteria bacterium]
MKRLYFWFGGAQALQRLLFICLVFIISLTIVYPLFQRGYFPMHDDTQIARVVEMTEALKDGQFPVRWVRDLGYGFGYPLYSFYGPLPYYIGSFFSLIGFSPLDATKIMMGLGMILPAMTMGLVLYSFFGFFPGLLGAVLYVFAPYHAVQLYVRGAVGELWTLSFLPLVLYGLMHASKGFRSTIVGAIGLAGVIVSHTVFGFIVVLLCVIEILCVAFFAFFSKKKSIRSYVLPSMTLVGIGMALSSFFWLPALVEMGYTNVASQVGGGADFKDHFVCISQFWSSAWGFGGSVPGCVDGLSFRLGKIFVFIFSLGSILVFWFRGKKNLVLSGSSIVLVVLSLYMMTQWSEWIWKFVPLLAYIQYPWRFLVFVVFGIAIIGAWSLSLLNKFRIQMAFVCLVTIGLTLAISLKLFTPQYIYDFGKSNTVSLEDIRVKYSQISDEYLPHGFDRKKSDGTMIAYGAVDGLIGVLSHYSSTSVKRQWDLYAEENSDVRLGMSYLPGWSVMTDGVASRVSLDRGMPNIALVKGAHIVDAKHNSTPIETLGNIISLVSVFLSIIYYGKKQIS